jgi:hypothetical protein
MIRSVLMPGTSRGNGSKPGGGQLTLAVRCIPYPKKREANITAHEPKKMIIPTDEVVRVCICSECRIAARFGSD